MSNIKYSHHVWSVRSAVPTKLSLRLVDVILKWESTQTSNNKFKPLQLHKNIRILTTVLLVHKLNCRRLCGHSTARQQGRLMCTTPLPCPPSFIFFAKCSINFAPGGNLETNIRWSSYFAEILFDI